MFSFPGSLKADLIIYMLVINSNFKTYESDIRALLNSFFPGEGLKFADRGAVPFYGNDASAGAGADAGVGLPAVRNVLADAVKGAGKRDGKSGSAKDAAEKVQADMAAKKASADDCVGTAGRCMREVVSKPGADKGSEEGDAAKAGKSAYAKGAAAGTGRGTSEDTAAPELSGEELTARHGAECKWRAAVPPAVLDVDAVCAGTVRSADRFTDKCAVKKALYIYLAGITGRTLPWGTLTGIRPLKLIDRYRAAGLDDEGIDSIFQNELLVSEEKRRLLFGIKRTEDETLEASGIELDKGYSIYIGIPFCPTRCVYCSFTSYPYDKWEKRAAEYIDDLGKELESIRRMAEAAPARSERSPRARDNTSRLAGKHPDTIYVGGGTPSALTAELIERLLTTIERHADPGRLREFTFEAGRPDTITREKLEVLRRHGVTRISVNPQSMNQKTLDLIGRKHTVEDICRIFRLARELGFDNINMDVIAGLPGEDLEDFAHTLKCIGELGPESLTVHTLAVKRASRLNTEGNAWGGLVRKGLDAEGMEEVAAMTALGAEYAAGHGLRPYYIYRQKNMAGSQENIGYSVPGTENLYNILMMEEKQTVIGVGAGASTKLVVREEAGGAVTRVRRYENVKGIEDYFSRVDELIRAREEFLGR